MLYAISDERSHHWFRLWLVACSVPSYYMDQCWIFVSLTLRKNFVLDIWVKIQHLCFKMMQLKMPSVRWWPFYSGFSVFYLFVLLGWAGLNWWCHSKQGLDQTTSTFTHEMLQHLSRSCGPFSVMSTGVGCCLLFKLEYYSSENLLKFISNKTLISLA